MKLLFATDASESARAAGALLATLPLRSETQLQVVTVVPDRPAWSAIFADRLADDSTLIARAEEEQRQRAERLLEETARSFAELGAAVTTSLRKGHAGSQILQAAGEMGAELIAVGSHGRTGWAGF